MFQMILLVLSYENSLTETVGKEKMAEWPKSGQRDGNQTIGPDMKSLHRRGQRRVYTSVACLIQPRCLHKSRQLLNK